jgi:hypothetical protein
MADSLGECVLCGSEVRSPQFDAGCPIFEAWAVVMAEWARHIGDLQEP